MRAPGTLRRGRLSPLGSKVLSAGFGLTVLSFAGSAPALTLVGIALILAPLAALLVPTRLGSLVIEARAAPGNPVETQVGDDAALTLLLGSTSPRGIGRFRVSWGGNGWAQGGATVARVPAGGWLVAPVTLTATGHAEVRDVYLDVVDTGALGLARRSAELRVHLPATHLIVPRTRRVPAPEAPPPVPGSQDEGNPQARAVTRGDFARGSRPFRAGDEPRAVSWRATARSGTLTVREWDPPHAPAPLAVAVLLPPVDGVVVPGQPVDADARAGEELLSALASLATAAAGQGRILSLTRAARVPATLLDAGPVPTSLVTASLVTASLVTASLVTAAGLDAAGLLRAMAGVPEVWVAPLSELAGAAARAAGPGGGVLLGVNLSGATWLPEAFLSCVDTAHALGCTLEVIVSYAGQLAQGTGEALLQLSRRCKVSRACDVLVPA